MASSDFSGYRNGKTHINVFGWHCLEGRERSKENYFCFSKLSDIFQTAVPVKAVTFKPNVSLSLFWTRSRGAPNVWVAMD